jgi:hypothetical protein
MDDYKTRLAPDGTLVVPAETTAAAGLTPGAPVVVRVFTGRVAVEAEDAEAASSGTIQSFWADINRIADSVPPEEWAKLPPDLSSNLDHYLYGAPKRR